MPTDDLEPLAEDELHRTLEPILEDQFERALSELEADGTSVRFQDGLSLLLPEQVERFRSVWDCFSEARKIRLLESLSAEESESLRLDFNAIYHVGMSDESSRVRLCAIESVVEDDSAWLLERLLELLADDDEAEVRAGAATALEPFSDRAELGELDDDSAARLRRSLLGTIHRPGERLDVRAAALATVGYFSDEVAQRELTKGFDDDGLRLCAVRGMGHSADSGWLDTLLPLLDEPDEALREAAATAVGEIGDQRAVPELIELIDDPDLGVRQAAIAALGDIGGQEARDALVYAAEDGNPEISEAAQAALEEIDFFEDPLQHDPLP